ncbi:F-box/kelch-repeat protein At3g27150-like [Mangifera indica]|uniref:F-box/kelch-repeat protein At3g27150-like n=1 Tax=Mangifera indica TaxID=29780 RepID=UPI001CFADC8D|nr:F-box/kelch-repeat protein At3g27150-like [Mangifera indica]XP_044465640.1 F-box/kelch-repeat protein At3g27150-like [Mangifera indica]XP_044465641.1 F-box/kelch-repeat protein At3g27150-like [Mangifera indica]XP_044465642.1 F-box/kelch-repeat protein At3g27150-like [Mangifera indica]XP_044465643.1 F-box/kelch-repeat protein At3g27150-like [Mangifera indica]XP_044465644.1 F-box/kelch-repeat protein At3g27150-like [Mangifera indica]
MSRDREIEGEEGREDLCINDRDILEGWVLVGDSSDDHLVSSPKRTKLCESRLHGSAGEEPQDADYSFVPSLNYDMENLIVARVPVGEHWKFYSVNKRFFYLMKSGELLKIRKAFGFEETTVFMFASGHSSWWAFDRQFKSGRMLPELPSELCFKLGDKESLCAGTHLIVSGKEVDGGVVWRYESETNKWSKGPSMISPRCLFASATCGTFAYVAGGLGLEAGCGVLNTAEGYNPQTKSWDQLADMNKQRKLCSGCYMDNKFYVIGGRNQDNQPLDCGECYDECKKEWKLIPGMLKDFPAETFQSPPLIAVVNNELYSLETSSNELRVYLKKSNSWKNLGLVPVRADVNRGWGVAFKSLGNELLVIGASAASHDSMSIYTCCPKSDSKELQWRLLECGQNPLSHFIHNCSVMIG